MERHGKPCSPAIPNTTDRTCLVRYMYDGGKLAQGRLTATEPARADQLSGRELLRCLMTDGVDLTRFYVSVAHCSTVLRESGTVQGERAALCAGRRGADRCVAGVRV